MNFGMLNDLNSALKIVTILFMQNIDIIPYLDRAFNSSWKTYFTC